MNETQVDGRLKTFTGLLAHWLWPARCLICQTPASVVGVPSSPAAVARDICAACADALPWNRSACQRCALPLPQPADECGHCLRNPPPIRHTHATFIYGFPLDRLLPRFKFRDDLIAGRLLSQCMHDTCGSLERPDALVPIPLHQGRLRQRGYDQALELARPLAASLALPLRDKLMVRTRHTQPQSRLGALQRRRNLRGAFEVRKGIALPRHVALIDDVMTTGATLHVAAQTLLRAGVERVDAWVCARAP